MAVDVGGAGEAKSEPNVVPLCDILLVLLIIFMVVTPMIQKGANVQLPEAQNTDEQPKPGDMIEISIEESGLILISGKSTVEKIEDVSKLTGKILDFIEKDQPENKTKVLLKADDNVAYGKVVDVMNEIKNAEIEVIGLVTKKIAK
jgi:biopolymer transport protein ExbD